MSVDINKNEYEFVSSAIDKILSDPIENIELTDGIPPLSDVSDSNKVFKGKLSILFVDMRKSSELTDELKSKKMVKIYRSFIRLIIQAIRYSGGYSRQFAGDGIMGVFQDSIDNDINKLSSQKAIKAGRYITTLIDYCLNPLLKKHIKGINIGCGIGICTGPIMIAKAGMRGKEADESCENELGIVWVGSTTNNASRYCSLAYGGEIFIDADTFNEFEIDDSKWVEVSRVKGTRTYKGYIATDYYLELDESIQVDHVKAILATDSKNSFVKDIFDQMTKEAVTLIDEIAKKSAEGAIKLDELKKREEQIKVKEAINLQNETKLNQFQSQLNAKQSSVNSIDAKNKRDEYELNFKIFSIVHCKKNLQVEMGKDFWEKHLKLLIELGSRIDKNETIVKAEICYALVDIYQNLNMNTEAYFALCIQAEYNSWILDTTVENIVRKTGCHSQIKGVIERRLLKPLTAETRDYLVKCIDKLKLMGY
ncbi:hypothetical protein K9O30_06330 [Clostridium bowmanii]|uniref:adenylate/guanylate cyclase domain-containing protein n=1 Tax=Clostridium bowmanii TaxID=132925 RepID=UPI001C0E7A84|nr:adenylate/guanylate cyclase domain-containing protein [Clostridium bowmanii]MBU3188777.1 hypothetical protein [Clostridium bowmanii]MCA1073361.1 hypothetical protein [Clostridium bowmanii]